MSSDHPRYTARTLAAAGGVSERAVRWYVEEGLLPPPLQRGRGPNFDDSHLLRLRLIKMMQDEGLDLDAIRDYLDELAREGAGAQALFENALDVWSRRREVSEWRAQAARYGGPGVVVRRYDICDGVSLHVDHFAGLSSLRLKAALAALKTALAGDD